MANTPRARLFVAAATALALLVGGNGSAYAAEPDTGGIAGHYTDGGLPVANATVSASAVDGSSYGSAITNEAGGFEIADLLPGQYRLWFGRPGGASQYYHGKTDYSQADLVTVTAGAITTADDEELPWALIQGKFSNRDGSGIGNAFVTLHVAQGGWAGGTYTDQAGNFSLAARPGSYRVGFQIGGFGSGSFTQYAYGKVNQHESQVFEIGDGQTVVVNDTLLPMGRITGRFTDASGNPVVGMGVWASRPVTSGSFAITDSDGRYTINYVPVGEEYRVQFSGRNPDLFQYAYGTQHYEQAATFTVAEGQETVVNDSIPRKGSLKVTATDAVTGARIDKFDVGLEGAGYGETVTGEVIVENVYAGTHPLMVTTVGYEHSNTTVTIVADQQVEVSVSLQPKARIETTVVDAATGLPVEGVCVWSAKLQSFFMPDGCGYISDANGKVLVETDGAGWYQLFAFPYSSEGYGAQWVGANGGTGKQLEAKLTRVEAGQLVTGPVVKLDRAGSITGVVTDAAGAVSTNTSVSAGDWSTHTGGGLGVTYVDDQGRYTINYLGPYEWPLMFDVRGERQYSGGVANRHLAQTVRVQSGQTATYDFRYRPWVTVTAKTTGLPSYCYLVAYNAITGDTLGEGWSPTCATEDLVFRLVGPQVIKLQVNYDLNGEWLSKWYGGGSFLTAKPVIIPASGSKTLNLAFG